VAEYALITSVMAAVIVGALSGGSLPTSLTKASGTVAAAARSAGVAPAEAQRAVARAPYTRPSLRTLYGLGWVAARRDRLTCAFARVSPGIAERAARETLRGVPGVGTLLRRAGLREAQAVRAVDRGFRAGCAG
jgi:ribosome modulation factor